MCHNATSFNGNISGWDVSSVINMCWMFYGATVFNQDLCAWGPVMNNQNIDVEDMFKVTSCADMSTPDLSATPPSPFCYVC